MHFGAVKRRGRRDQELARDGACTNDADVVEGVVGFGCAGEGRRDGFVEADGTIVECFGGDLGTSVEGDSSGLGVEADED